MVSVSLVQIGAETSGALQAGAYWADGRGHLFASFRVVSVEMNHKRLLWYQHRYLFPPSSMFLFLTCPHLHGQTVPKAFKPPVRCSEGSSLGRRGSREVPQRRETSATEGLNTENGVSNCGGEQTGLCSSVLSCLIHLSPFHPKVQKPRAPETNIVF